MKNIVSHDADAPLMRDCNLNKGPDFELVLDILPHPVIIVGVDDRIGYANQAAENFFSSSSSFLTRHRLSHFVPFGSPVLALVSQVREQGMPVNEYKLDISSPRIGQNRFVDVYAAPMGEHSGEIIMVFQMRTMAEKIDRQLIHRSAARTVTTLSAMLAHEIKNPLAGIRGAAQLLESCASEDDRPLARLIMEETDRIVTIVNRMEVFTDERPIERSAVNIHKVLERVKKISETGFAKGITIREQYDPSLPPVFANSDLLLQVFINLVKNAAEALAGQRNGEIVLSTAFRPGIHLSSPSSSGRVALPLEFCVTDNGPGIAENIVSHIFEPFVTGKINGSGLGLALVAKIVGDHGGVIECESGERSTRFRILLPAYRNNPAQDGGNTEQGEF